MNQLIIGLYGVYLIIVGVQGHAREVIALAGMDGKGYLPWLLAVIVLATFNSFEATKPVVKPFIILLLLNFFLLRYDTIQDEIKRIGGF